MKTVNVLISTMNRRNLDFVNAMNINSPAIVINQTTNDNIIEIRNCNNSIKVINSFKKGLSKSRNLALKHACADISLIADDDMIYHSNYKKLILKAYEDYPEADIIAFQVRRIGKKSNNKHFLNKYKKINYISSLKITSVEITFKTESVKEKAIEFNENIGAGTDFLMGEENQFLFDCLRAGLKIQYVPIEIAVVDTTESTWLKGYNKDYFISTGAKFYNMTNFYYPLLIFQFAFRKRRLFSGNYSTFDVLKYMFLGVKKYKDLERSS